MDLKSAHMLKVGDAILIKEMDLCVPTLFVPSQAVF